MGIEVEPIRKQDLHRLAEFDALLIRETTAITNHTYRFARRAEREGLAVIDDPTSIVRCTNKVYLAELLAANGVPMPRTVVLDRRHLKAVGAKLAFPLVLKVPDGSFSRGVFKVNDEAELQRRASELLEDLRPDPGAGVRPRSSTGGSACSTARRSMSVSTSCRRTTGRS